MNRSNRPAYRSSPSVYVPLISVAALFLAACERPPIESTQIGYRGTGMVDVVNPRRAAATRALNEAPVAPPQIPDDGGPRARDVYQNVQVLGDLGVGQFTRLMTQLTAWVSPEQGCIYCHVGGNMASDDIYTKIVSRRMIQMTIDINENWTQHVAETGVTCYTCHRGQNVPGEIWFESETDPHASGFTALTGGQNSPSEAVGLSSLPYDPFTRYLEGAQQIRLQPETALPAGEGASIQMTEQTYGFMMHMSTGLGVNCTYCHNTRAFQNWEQSNAARVTAWHGIRMARYINTDYMVPLTGEFPPERLGPLGDVPKANCATCHRGVSKPLYGAGMAQDFPSLTGD